MPHYYSHEQELFIKENIMGRPMKELTSMFNDHFKLELKYSQIRAFAKRKGLKNGLNTQFKKGQEPPNKGKKGVGGWEPTQFKKGHKPHNYKPIGTERTNGEGYVDIKVADPNVWKAKHILIWEQENGPVPPGHVILFGDGNRKNFDLDNLILVTRKQLGMLNQKGLIRGNADLTRTGIIIADLYGKIAQRSKSK